MKKALTFIMALLGLNVHTACSQGAFENAKVNEFATLIEQEDVQLVDVRTPAEFAEGHIAGAVNIDVKASDFKEKALATLDKARPVAVYCRSGRRSVDAANVLTKEGFRVTNLLGGINAWTEERPVTTDTTETDRFKTPGGKTVEAHALMHACVRIVFDGHEIQVDPVRQLGQRTVDYSTMPKADYIFVTHEHGDHYDKEAINILSNGNTQLITNKRCADMAGFGTIMANGDKKELETWLKVEAVPAYNTTEGRTQFHPKGRDNGYVLTLDGLRIYFAGDTEDIPEMAEIKDIDIAFLPCNQPYTMTVEQVARAARIIKPKVLFPYHYGNTDVSSLPALLKGDGIDVRIRHYE